MGKQVGGSWDLDAVGAAFAEAAVDPSVWNTAMAAAGHATGSLGALLIPVRGRLPTLPFSESIGAVVESYIDEGWIHHDTRDQCVPIMARYGVSIDLDFMTAEEIGRHPYYQDFLARHGLSWFAGVSVSTQDDLWCLSIQRDAKRGPFSPRETAQLARLHGISEVQQRSPARSVSRVLKLPSKPSRSAARQSCCLIASARWYAPTRQPIGCCTATRASSVAAWCRPIATRPRPSTARCTRSCGTEAPPR